jgi:hypothetical protein
MKNEKKTKPLAWIIGTILFAIVVCFFVILVQLAGGGHYQDVSFGEVIIKCGSPILLISYALKMKLAKKDAANNRMANLNKTSIKKNENRTN